MPDAIVLAVTAATALTLGGMLAVARDYARLARARRWLALPAHVWRVAVGTALVTVAGLGLVGGGGVWAAGILLAGNFFIWRGLGRMRQHLQERDTPAYTSPTRDPR